MSPWQLFLILCSLLFCSSYSLCSDPDSSQKETHFLRAQEYTYLLNAVATKSDVQHLYSYKMEEDGFIRREGKPGHYSYQCLNTNAILGDLTYFSVLRFCNWMENECPEGEENRRTTEQGTYDLTSLSSEVENPNTVLLPKAGATWRLATNSYVALPSKRLLPAEEKIDTALAYNSIGFCIMRAKNLSITPHNTPSQNGFFSASTNHDFFQNTSGAQQKNILSPCDTSLLATAVSVPLLSTKPIKDFSIKIDLVTIGSPNNDSDAMPPRASDRNGDPKFHYGSVDHAYQIGKYDVTVSQYRNFLMSVARTEDPYRLFNPAMQTNQNVSSIIKSTNSTVENGVTTTTYTYTVVEGRENYPITYVSYWSAVRFCNWLANGQPQDIGECNPKTTEDGSYCFSNGTPTLRTNAIWRLPTQDEWYKAAYKVPTNKEEYWVYSTGNKQPHNSATLEENQTDSPYKNVNYCRYGVWTAAASPWITPVGVFSNSPGPWGTYDMGGNVAQITDDSWTLVANPTPGIGARWKLITRGGSWRSTDSSMISAQQGYQYIDPNDANEGASETVGFRVVCALPPEKHTLSKTLQSMFQEDLENAREGNDSSVVNLSSYFMGLGLGFGIEYATERSFVPLAIKGILTALSFSSATIDFALLLSPYGIAACVCLGVALYVYETNINDQTPYDANPMMKRTGIGCALYVPSATLWMVGKAALSLLL